MPIFDSILPISLQPIASEKTHEVHSNELTEGYTLIPMTIFIDNYLRGDIEKLVDISRISLTRRGGGVLNTYKICSFYGLLAD